MHNYPMSCTRHVLLYILREETMYLFSQSVHKTNCNAKERRRNETDQFLPFIMDVKLYEFRSLISNLFMHTKIQSSKTEAPAKKCLMFKENHENGVFNKLLNIRCMKTSSEEEKKLIHLTFAPTKYSKCNIKRYRTLN